MVLPGHSPPSATGKVLFGNCGWTQDKSSPWGSCRSSREKLEVYARHFSCVEVDTTTYAIPSPSVVQDWLSATLPAGFVFHVKLFGLLAAGRCQLGQLPVAVRDLLGCTRQTAHDKTVLAREMPSAALQKCWDIFNDMLAALDSKGRLGTVVLQHQNDVGPSIAAQQLTEEIRRRLFSSAPLAIEFRNRDWISTEEGFDKTVRWLNDRCGGAAVICADDLLHELRPDRKLGPNESRCRLPLRLAIEGGPGWAYCRIHRRQGGVSERLLLAEEVMDWQTTVAQAACKGALNRGPCYILMGTDSSDAPIQNAMAIVRGKPDWYFDWAAYRLCHPPQATLSSFFRSHVPNIKKHSSLEEHILESDDRSDGSVDWATPPRVKSSTSSEVAATASSDVKKLELPRAVHKSEVAKAQTLGQKRLFGGTRGLTLENVFAKKQRQPAVTKSAGADTLQEDTDLAEAIRRSLEDASVIQIL